MRVLGLIPVRLKSKRLYEKPLLMLKDFPMFVHVYKRSKMSKLLDDLYVCCDDKKINNLCKKFNINSIMTSRKHTNGTDRICEGYLKLKKKYDFIVDIQGDEPFISPKHIDKVIMFHKKNKKADIVLPSLRSKYSYNPNIVKVITNKNKKVLYLSRSTIPYFYKNKKKYINKHLSIISFKPKALTAFSKQKRTKLEIFENVELIRALEIDLNILSFQLHGDSFSVDVREDYLKALRKIRSDKFYDKYVLI